MPAPGVPVSSPQVQSLFPPGVAAAELHGQGDPALLFPEELRCVPSALEVRLRQFAGGRLCARRALVELGLPDAPLLMAPAARWPLWPEGVIGSITHTEQYCAAVATRAAGYLGLGLDSEHVSAVFPHLADRICTDRELERIAAAPADRRQAALALAFSAREAFYKAQYPLTREALGMQDVYIELDVERLSGEFKVLPVRRLQLERLLPGPWPGRFRIHGALISTGLALPSRPQ